MTQFGTPLAASLASTPLQAQQVGRQQGQSQTRQAADAKRIRQMIESHMQSLEEGDEDSVDQIRVDGQPPHQRGRQSQDQFLRQDASQEENPPESADPSPQPPAEILGPPAPDPAVIAQLLESTQRIPPADGDKEPAKDPLYKHLDLQA